MNISLNNFEEHIDKTILKRGLTVLQNGNISEVEKIKENEYTATVKGTETYIVNINLDKSDNLYTHHCTCPYTHGAICKHKAAVLFQIRHQKKNNLSFKKSEILLIKNKLEEYSKKELEQIIVELAKNNLKTRNQLLNILEIKKD